MTYNPDKQKQTLQGQIRSVDGCCCEWGNGFINSTRKSFMSQNAYHAMEKKQLK